MKQYVPNSFGRSSPMRKTSKRSMVPSAPNKIDEYEGCARLLVFLFSQPRYSCSYGATTKSSVAQFPQALCRRSTFKHPRYLARQHWVSIYLRSIRFDSWKCCDEIKPVHSSSTSAGILTVQTSTGQTYTVVRQSIWPDCIEILI